MLDNIIIGPICVVIDEDSRKHHLRQLYFENWLALYETKSGDLFEDIKSKLNPNEQKNLKGVIISIGFKNTYIA